MLPRRWALGDFRPIKKLYKGYASKVYLAEDNGKVRKRSPNNLEISISQKGRHVVLKVYDLMRLSPLTRYQLEREIRLHQSVSHPNIVTLHAAFEEV
jgi:serine/threonine protein kinase